jgi:arylsulfatase A-like enzyme
MSAAYNTSSKIPTPNLDRLAATGIRFTDAHASDAVCTPTRYGLLLQAATASGRG